MNTEIINKNYVSRRQFIILAVGISICTKVSMLPLYISSMLNRDGIFAITIIVILELILISIVYNISNKGGIMYCLSPIAQKIIVPIIAAVIVTKMLLHTTAIINFTATIMFDDVNWFFITILLIGLVFYISNKKAYILGRFGELFFWVLVFSVGFHILFADIDVKPEKLLPFFEHTPTEIVSSIPSFLWFSGDALPLIFIGIKPKTKDTPKRVLPFYFIAYAIGIIGFYFIFYIIYGNLSGIIPHAFHRVGIFNKVTPELKGIDAPIIITWLTNFILNLSLLSFGFMQCIKVYYKKFKWYGIPALLFLILYFNTIENIGDIGKYYVESILKYFAALMLLLAIIIISVIKTKRIESYAFLKEKVQNEEDKSA